MRGRRLGWLAVMGGCVVLCAAAKPLRAEQWRDYGPQDRARALRNFRRHQAAPDARREEVERQYRRWQTMPQSERDRLQENYERYRQLSPAERKRFDRQYRVWKRGADRPAEPPPDRPGSGASQRRPGSGP